MAALGSGVHALRVNQLDAARLDGEIALLVRQQLAEASIGGTLDRWQPELDAVVRAVIWRYSVWADAPTPGCALQNMVYSRADVRGIEPKRLLRWQKLAFLLLNVLLPWLAARLQDAAQPGADFPGAGGAGSCARRRCQQQVALRCLRRVLPRLAPLHAVCTALNLLLFVRNGVFCSLSDRVLGIRLVPIDPAARRQVAFQYMNRVMIWNGLSEFLMTVIPLVNLAKLRQTLTRQFFPRSLLRSIEAAAEASCGLCGAEDLALPVRSDCGHLFCYFCLASEQMDSPGRVPCPRCSSLIRDFAYAT